MADDSVKLKNGEPARVTIDCRMSAMDSIGAALGGLLGGGDVSFKLKGEATGRIWFFPRTYTIESDVIRL